MKKNTGKSILLFVLFAVLTAAMITAGCLRHIYLPEMPEEGAALGWQNWLAAVWWILTGLFAAIAVGSIAAFPLKKRGWPASVKLALFVIALLAVSVGIVMGTSALGVDINAAIISLGVVGTCIAIGCEPLMYDMVGGLGFISGRDFEVGDIITVDGFRGTVTDITLRCVKVQDAGGNIQMIRNSEIASVVNLSRRPSAAVVRIPYDPEEGDLESFEEKLRESFASLAASHPDVFSAPPVYQGVDSYDADGVLLLVTAEVPEEKVYAARRLMNRTALLLREKPAEEAEAGE